MELVGNMLKKYPQNANDGAALEKQVPKDSMGRFFYSAKLKVQSISDELTGAKSSFGGLLRYFGDSKEKTPKVFFGIINTFIMKFEQAHRELRTKEAKVCASCMI